MVDYLPTYREIRSSSFSTESSTMSSDIQALRAVVSKLTFDYVGIF